jgi:hypothetical protein
MKFARNTPVGFAGRMKLSRISDVVLIQALLDFIFHPSMQHFVVLEGTTGKGFKDFTGSKISGVD